MPGLRNSGIDTSAWYLAGYSGTELLVNDPKFINPATVFGGFLPVLTPLFDLNFATASLFGGTFTRGAIGASAFPHSEDANGKLIANQPSATTPVWQRSPMGGPVLGLRLNPTHNNQFGTNNNIEGSDWGETNMTATTFDNGDPSNSPFAGQTACTQLTGAAGTNIIRDTFFSNISYSPSIDKARNYIDGWFKAGNTSEFFIGFRSNLAPTVNFGGAIADLAAGTLTVALGGNGQVIDGWITPYPDGWWRVGVIGRADSVSAADDDRCSIVLTSNGALSHSIGGQTLFVRALSGDGFASGLYGPGYGHLRSSGALGFSANAETYANTLPNLPANADYTVLYDLDLLTQSGGSTAAGQQLHHLGNATSTAGANSFGILTATSQDAMRFNIKTGNTIRLSVDAALLMGRSKIVMRATATDTRVYRNGVLLGTGSGGQVSVALANVALSGQNMPGTIMRRISVYGTTTPEQAQALSSL
jgi:hypothetical protein